MLIVKIFFFFFNNPSTLHSGQAGIRTVFVLSVQQLKAVENQIQKSELNILHLFEDNYKLSD